MKETTTTKTCDRCNYSIQHKKGIIDYIPVERDGFHQIEGRKGFFICNTCYHEYLNALHKFMESKIHEVNEK
jgi:hypothetical protein